MRTLIGYLVFPTIVCLFSCSFTASAQTQPSAGPPANSQEPSQAAPGPSLQVTLGFILEKLNGIGTIEYTDDYGSQHITSISDLAVDVDACTLRFVNSETSKYTKYDYWMRTVSTEVIHLGDVRTVTVGRLYRELNAPAITHPQTVEFKIEGTPDLLYFHETNQMSKNQKTWKDYKVGAIRSGTSGVVYGPTFLDEDMAYRVAKAFAHAADLCAAKQKPAGKRPDEPF